jgi:3-isopropylmalate dehydratase
VQTTKLPFTSLRGIAAPLTWSNIDTNMLFPKQFCKTIKRTGLSHALFYHLRFHKDGTKRTDFVLNNAPYRYARFLVLKGKNFGCGSSREHALWALKDFGIMCIVPRSFPDTFYKIALTMGCCLSWSRMRCFWRKFWWR